jgi:diaminopimelate epimerase
MKVAKAHGLGNDFLIVAAKDAPAARSEWARRICERHVGLGADGVLLHAPHPDGVRMTLVNADGGEAEISANGLRCLAAFMVSRHGLPARHVVVTGAGPREVTVRANGGTRFEVDTDLGTPVLSSERIPVAITPSREPVVALEVELPGGRTVAVTATSMGNPHCALFLDRTADDAFIDAVGPALEHHPLFPRRTNVEFITVLAPDRLRVRFWERGVGPTRASGTGSASAVVAAVVSGRAERAATVVCDGGTLRVEWRADGRVRQTGEVEILMEGEWLIG